MSNSINVSKSNLFHAAWDYFKKNLYNSFSECLKAAWKALKAKAALKAGKIELTFRKASGEITTRIATLQQELLPVTEKTSNRTLKSDVVVFFSITDNGFRSFRIERLIKFCPVNQTGTATAVPASISGLKMAA